MANVKQRLLFALVGAVGASVGAAAIASEDRFLGWLGWGSLAAGVSWLLLAARGGVSPRVEPREPPNPLALGVAIGGASMLLIILATVFTLR